MPNDFTGTSKVASVGGTEEQKASVLRLHHKPEPVPAAARVKEADAAPTILGREMALRGWDARKVAEKSQVLASRIETIAAGARIYDHERPKLEKVFGDSADLLVAPNTPENRARQNGLV